MSRRGRIVVACAAAGALLAASSSVLVNLVTSPGGSTVLIVLLGGLVALSMVVAAVPPWLQGRTSLLGERERLEAAKELLVRRVRGQWEKELRVRLLNDPAPMPVEWRAAPRSVVDPWLADSADREGAVLAPARSDHVAVLAAAFKRAPRKRLVLVGSAGTGKTTLAMQLLLELLEHRRPADPVPVLLTVTGWNLEKYPELWDWVAHRLDRDYPALRAVGTDVGPALVADRSILPVLDGLDEIPAVYRPRMVAALNRSMNDSDQLVMTCRTGDYQETVARGDVLTAATVLEAQPLRHVDIVDYLQACIPASATELWRPVLDALRNDSASPLVGVCRTPLGLWLVRTVYIEHNRDPSALADPDRYPDRASLQGELLDELVVAVLDRPRQVGAAGSMHHWTPEKARRWLTELAIRLTGSQSRDLRWWCLPPRPQRPRRSARRRWVSTLGGALGSVIGLVLGAVFVLSKVPDSVIDSGGLDFDGLVVEIALCSIPLTCAVLGAWTGVGVATRRLRPDRPVSWWLTGALSALVGLLFVQVVAVILEAALHAHEPLSTAIWLTTSVVGLIVGSWVGSLIHSSATGPDPGQRRRVPVPVRANVRLRGRVWLLIRKLLPGTLFGLLNGVVFAAVVATVESTDVLLVILPVIGLTVFYGSLYALAFGLLSWAREPSTLEAAATPVRSLREDRSFTLLRVVRWLLIAGGCTIVILSADDDLANSFVTFAVLAMVAGVVTVFRSAWGSYLATILPAAARRRLPMRLSVFCEDMYRLGLLRVVGASYQFRHAELQDHLACEQRRAS